MLPAVELFTLTKRFGSQIALADISLQVDAGEFLTLLGPSGCGKTTLLRLIAGLEHPDTGRIHLAGQDITNQPAYRRPVHTVFQNYALFPHLNVGDNIAFGLMRKGQPQSVIRQRVEAMLKLVGLEGIHHQYPHELSGGQQQRVALARALACEPPVLLLDEPMSALDPHLRRHMRRELKALQRQLGMTFILVTHDQVEALTLSDRIAVMHSGRILQVGTPEELHTTPSTAFVASFIGNCNLLRGEVRRTEHHTCTVVIGEHLVNVANNHLPTKPGQTVTIAVHPESIQVASLSDVLSNHRTALTGQLTERAYAGSETYWTIRLSDGQVITAALRHTPTSDWAVGTRVQVFWPPSQAVIVKPDDT
ncbi:MAG: ABC transporter ATP-binding protein [Chloracidobacterium sp.]|uniref:Spermidine/putrescine import ATP-binding protein PotA n=1 Tax=Chloracidobacterium validum TaxID=2821543 RepID=A0ABX8BEG8_9BACT|nr:ABC transporter ATP-binding protein [Chloracidobacterium validum]QUW03465.1 ABC transporter ATP-binding protein [Chloracidobacterium validum]